ncbi:YceI family protein [Polymorphobacter sp. PAMC 29334]|uniref:YceI family protein n=1 Tax=Polymorphobacter sp. PAMC 29334 TaxID=2862331 RepID=UPI001C668BCC|nr:YceI family protein [Polymorphobacter sp. PAMC 29334]QYE36331.1 YceI family protein [Polymorphobacter sp. PAMC 29334]
MNIRVIVGSLTAFAAALATQGLAQQVASTSPASVKAGTYSVEPGHTQVTFSVSHFGFTEYSGVFSGASGSLRIDPASPAAAKLDVSMPVGTVQTTSAKLDGELKGDQWFDAAKFPTATFDSTKVTSEGPGRATIAGNLTLHGVTRPVILQAQFVGAGVNPLDKSETIGFSATGTIRRSEFGVTKYVPLVGDEVKLSIAGAFTRAN